MKFAILSRNKSLHSVRRLLGEAHALKITCDVINPLDCNLVVNGKESCILIGTQQLDHYDAVLPRIGASITEYGIAVVQQFQSLGQYVINPARAIAESRDKMRCLQILSKSGLKVPPTVLSRSPRALKSSLEHVGGLPVVLKLLEGTQGVGVMLVNTHMATGSVLDTLRSLEQDVLIQKYIAAGAGTDYRLFVIGDQVVASMMRTAPDGDFRANIHRGGEGKLVKLPKNYHRIAIQAAKTLGLEIAGVDLMEDESGPVVLEVNSSPGFEGIERATGLNIARMIMSHAQKRARAAKRRRKKKH
jgi:ribosomal protein S6--L-glutamate ligase